MVAAQRSLPLPPALAEAGSAAIVAVVLASVWNRAPDFMPGKLGVGHWLGSPLLGVVTFLLWIAPDSLIAGYRHHVWFENPVFGSFAPGLTAAARAQPAVIWIRAFRAILLTPVAEELFWRAWMMRWIARDDFLALPLGTYTPRGFWTVAVLFGMEHGPLWDVGIVTGVLYNGWMVRTRSLGDVILVHAITNACLSAYVLTNGKWEYWP